MFPSLVLDPFPRWNAGSDATAYFSTILRRRHAPHFGRGVMTAVTLAAPWLNYFDPKDAASVPSVSILVRTSLSDKPGCVGCLSSSTDNTKLSFPLRIFSKVAVGTLIVKTSAGP